MGSYVTCPLSHFCEIGHFTGAYITFPVRLNQNGVLTSPDPFSHLRPIFHRNFTFEGAHAKRSLRGSFGKKFQVKFISLFFIFFFENLSQFVRDIVGCPAWKIGHFLKLLMSESTTHVSVVGQSRLVVLRDQPRTPEWSIHSKTNKGLRGLWSHSGLGT